MGDFRLIVTAPDGRRQELGLLRRLSWGGTWRDCARTLHFTAGPEDLCPLGGTVRLEDDQGQEAFVGSIRARSQAAEDGSIDCTAFDRGLLLKANSIYRKVRGAAPETLAAQLCREFGIPAGTFARTGVPISRNFFGVDLYRTIMTAYTLAGQRTGKEYLLRVRGDKVEVVEKGLDAGVPVLAPGDNILRLESSESAEHIVTDVELYDSKARRTAVYHNDGQLRKLFGAAVQAVHARKGEDPAAQARELLAEGGIQTTITATCLGDLRLVSGRSVVVHEPVTGTEGRFWIIRDQHSMDHGIYQVTMTLDFKGLMDRQHAGSAPGKRG